MVYAAYAGTGKSYFCQEHPEADRIPYTLTYPEKI